MARMRSPRGKKRKAEHSTPSWRNDSGLNRARTDERRVMTLCHRHSSSRAAAASRPPPPPPPVLYHHHHHCLVPPPPPLPATTTTTTITAATICYYYDDHHHHHQPVTTTTTTATTTTTTTTLLLARLRTRVKLTNPLAEPNTCAVRAGGPFLTGPPLVARALLLSSADYSYINFVTIGGRARRRSDSRVRSRSPLMRLTRAITPSAGRHGHARHRRSKCRACQMLCRTLRCFRVTDIGKIWLPPHTQKPLRHPDGWHSGHSHVTKHVAKNIDPRRESIGDGVAIRRTKRALISRSHS